MISRMPTLLELAPLAVQAAGRVLARIDRVRELGTTEEEMVISNDTLEEMVCEETAQAIAETLLAITEAWKKEAHHG